MPYIKDIKKNCLYFSSNRLARAMTKISEECFKEIGFSPTYAYLLMTLYDLENASSKQLAEELYITQSTLTRLVDKMVYQGYIERKHVGRNSQLSLTQKGLDIQKPLSKQWIKLHEKYSKFIGDDEGKALVKTITKAAEKLEN